MGILLKILVNILKFVLVHSIQEKRIIIQTSNTVSSFRNLSNYNSGTILERHNVVDTIQDQFFSDLIRGSKYTQHNNYILVDVGLSTPCIHTTCEKQS